MIHFIVLFTSSFLYSAQATENVEYIRENNRLFVIAKDCKTTNQLATSLQDWKIHLGETNQEVKLEESPQSPCKLDITDLTPNFVREYHGIAVPNDWPNCWGTTLAAAGIIPYFTETTQAGEDIQSWMSPPLCNPVVGKPKPGDIGAIRAGHREIHGFIYINKDVAFSKNSLSSKDPFLIQDMTKMLEKTNQGSHQIDYYRCNSIAQFKKEMKTVSEKYNNQDEELKKAEKKMAETALHCSNSGIEETKSKLDPIVNAIWKLSVEESKKESNSPSEKLLWKVLYLRAQSLENYL